jgi:hypothetical protein
MILDGASVTAELEQMERGAKIFISCLVEYKAEEKAEEKRERERESERG